MHTPNYNYPIQNFKRANNPSAQFSIVIPTWNNLAYLQLCILDAKRMQYKIAKQYFKKAIH